jgi:hypothetical protein
MTTTAMATTGRSNVGVAGTPPPDLGIVREAAVVACSAARMGTHRLLAAAGEVTREHRPDADGWCQGCLRLWSRLAWYPCEQASWAAAVAVAAAFDPVARGRTGPEGNGRTTA